MDSLFSFIKTEKLVTKKKDTKNKKSNHNKIRVFNNKLNNKFHVSGKSFYVRFYFKNHTDEKKLLYLEKNALDLFLYIQSKIENSFVLSSENVSTYYSKEDNQVRVIINYSDDNIKRIFINTSRNLFFNLKYFIEREPEFYNLFDNFFIEKITITDENENNILSIIENKDKFEKKIQKEQKDPSGTVFDYVIIGGGPGGIMTAYTLSKNNPDKSILILEANEKTHDDYKNLNYNKTNNWWLANNDSNFKETLTDTTEMLISQGIGLGGGTLHFGLQYVDHYDLINLDYAPWLNEFKKLDELLKPKLYQYNKDKSATKPTPSHFELLSELSNNTEILTYNNKIYSKDLINKDRILYGDFIKDQSNITVVYGSKIKKLNFNGSYVISCETFDNKLYFGNYFSLASGAIHTPCILQRSGIDCGNKIYDHAGITLLYKKKQITQVKSYEKNVDGYTKSEIEDNNIPVLSIDEIKNMNSKEKIVAIFNHTKLSNDDFSRAQNGNNPNINVSLGDSNSSVKYVYDMGSFWSSEPKTGPKHPGQNLHRYLTTNNYDLTSTLLWKHGQTYSKLFRGSAKLIGVYGTKTLKLTDKDEKLKDLGFNNDNIIPHIQTRDKNHKWQTYYSNIPGFIDTLIVTHAQSKNIPSTGKVKIKNNDTNDIEITLDHLGNEKQKELTINYIYDAYIKNDKSLSNLNYYYDGPKITKKYIEKNLNSIYHYHGSCPTGEVVDEKHKVYNTSNLYISDLSILNKPWPGSTSVIAGVVGTVTGNNISQFDSLNLFNWINIEENDRETVEEVNKAIKKWNSVMSLNNTIKSITITFDIKSLDDNILGQTELLTYKNLSSNQIKDLNEKNYHEDIQYHDMGEIIPHSGRITFNSKLWKRNLNFIRDDGLSNAYYIALHELGHILGIGALWVQNGAMLYDDKSETFFYGGNNGNREYKNLFPKLDLTYMPIENNGGPGTHHVHPEEGHEEGISVNDRYFNGVLHPGLNEELMTGFAENTSVPLPLSKVTLGMLEDLGFGVDYSKADDFEI